MAAATPIRPPARSGGQRSHVLRLLAATSGIALAVTACSSSSKPVVASSAPAVTSQSAAPSDTGSASGASSPVASSSTAPSDAQAGTDDGAKLTMWVRSATDVFSKRLVDDYNATHKNHITLTVVPNDNYLQKVGAAAGSNSLPDLLAADVVYSANYVHQGLYQDITAQLKALPYFDKLSQAHMQAASADGKIYAVPHKVDSSLILYNKDLFKKAGLDPEAAPKTFNDLYNDAKAIRALGGDTYGFYFAGNCAGCNAYTLFPYSVAAGHPPVSLDGKTADVDNDALKQATALYKKMYDEGIVASGAKADDGATWLASFMAGKVGILPAGSFLFGDLQTKAKFAWGVASLMAPDGSKTATFVGGDDLGISKSSKQEAEAFNFVAWTLGDHAQVEDIAKGGDLPARTDLAGNQYTSKDPRASTTVAGLANGYTPSVLPYGGIFNDATGPWLQMLRGAFFGTDPAKAFSDGQAKIQAALTSG